MDNIIFIVQLVVFVALLAAYYLLFGRIETSKKARILEVVSLYGLFIIFGLSKSIKGWILLVAIFIVGLVKYLTAKNEREHTRVDV